MAERRGFGLALVVAILLALTSAAQAQTKRVALFAATACPSADNPSWLKPLAARGWVVGQNLEFECLLVGERFDRIPELAAELVARKPDVLVAGASPHIRALMLATTTIPIVIFAAADPVRERLVSNLRRPDGNVTGHSEFSIDLFAKRIELLALVTGWPKKVAVLWRDGGDPGYQAALTQEADKSARAGGYAWKPFSPRTADDFDPTFTQIRVEGFDMVHVVPTPLALIHRKRVGELALRERLPAIGEFDLFAEDGLLMAYSPDRSRFPDLTADYVDKLLRGAKPADLPVHQPTEFRLVVNARTARALGMAVPQSVLHRADAVID